MSQVAERKQVVRPLRDGRLVIPTEFREALGLGGDDALLVMTLVEGELRIWKANDGERVDVSDWLKELYDYFAPAREEAIEKGSTEQEINDWINQAVAEVRAERGRS